jgi:hypothetical protein
VNITLHGWQIVSLFVVSVLAYLWWSALTYRESSMLDFGGAVLGCVALIATVAVGLGVLIGWLL